MGLEPGNGREFDWRSVCMRVLRDSAVTVAVGSALLALVGLLLPWRLAPLPAGLVAYFIAYYVVLRAYAVSGGASFLTDLSVWCTVVLTGLVGVGLQSLACGIQSCALRAAGRVPSCIDCNPDHRGFVNATSVFLLLLPTLLIWGQMRHRAWSTRRRLRRQGKQGPRQ